LATDGALFIALYYHGTVNCPLWRVFVLEAQPGGQQLLYTAFRFTDDGQYALQDYKGEQENRRDNC
jgi:hypothetical protein